MLENLWFALSTRAQDMVLLGALLMPFALTATLCLWGYHLRPLVIGLLRRHLLLSLTFILLIATSVALSVGLLAQERGLREGTARAAEKFDLVIAAPGSEFSAMLAAVYLQPSALPLIDGETFARIEAHELVALAAPLAFGDSWQGIPVIGTTREFIAHLAGDLAAGQPFATTDEAVVGASVPLDIGETFEPLHGHGANGAVDQHGFEYRVVGRMPRTGSPWDKAILVAVESVWEVHALPNGHGPDWDGTLGGPFEPSRFPGTPAVLVRATELWASYAVQSEFTSERTMAFFPGTVLARLHTLMGDIRQLMSVLAVVTQVLVAVAVLAGLAMLSRLLARRLALFQALGASRGFIFALTWSFSTALIVTGALLGVLLGMGATAAISAAITARTDILVTASLAWSEMHLVAAFVSTVTLLSLFPAYLACRRSPLQDLRG